MLRNSTTRFGTAAILLHWIVAIGVVAEFALGLYMTSLDYYHRWSQLLPHVHESLGILLAVLIVVRIGWALANPRPDASSAVGPVERVLSRFVQFSMNLILVAIVSFGYLCSTAEGDPVAVFDWFAVPAFGPGAEESLAWFWHYWLAWVVMGMATLHALGALKHHLIDRDQTLNRMLGRNRTGVKPADESRQQ